MAIRQDLYVSRKDKLRNALNSMNENSKMMRQGLREPINHSVTRSENKEPIKYSMSRENAKEPISNDPVKRNRSNSKRNGF